MAMEASISPSPPLPLFRFLYMLVEGTSFSLAPTLRELIDL